VCRPIYAEDRAKTEAIRKVVKFRNTPRGLVPYIELKHMLAEEGSGCLPIDSVRFGPTQTPDLTKSVTRMLLDSNDLSNAKIEGSEIPVMLNH
jgi:hypothetical protein